MSQPLTRPKASARTSGGSKCHRHTECPFCTICSTSPGGTASAATIEMSMPRPMIDDRHPQAQNAEDGNVLQQGDHVVGRREARKEKREANEQHHENAEDDALLRDPLLPHCLEAPRAKHIRRFCCGFAPRTKWPGSSSQFSRCLRRSKTVCLLQSARVLLVSAIGHLLCRCRAAVYFAARCEEPGCGYGLGLFDGSD